MHVVFKIAFPSGATTDSQVGGAAFSFDGGYVRVQPCSTPVRLPERTERDGCHYAGSANGMLMITQIEDAVHSNAPQC